MYINLFNDIPQNAKICIYGSGDIGLLYKTMIEKIRKDVTVQCFLDSFKEGEISGLKIIKISDFKESNIDYDFIVITSSQVYNVAKLLFLFGIENYISLNFNNFAAVHNYYKVQEYNQSCTNDFLTKNAKRLNAVKDLFATDEDRKLFALLLERRSNAEGYYKFFDYSLGQYENLQNQYLDYINKDKIKTVIDCGLFDGDTAILFLNHFKNVEKIYGFEPLYEQFKTEPFATVINKTDKVEIINSAVSNETGETSFCNELLGSRMVTEKYTSNLKEEVSFKSFLNKKNGAYTQKVKIDTIDNFAKTRNIKKIDFIKVDVEGADLKALQGAEKTILKDRPQISVAIYHSPFHFYEIPLYLGNLLTDYTFRLGHYTPGDCETNFYAIPNELL